MTETNENSPAAPVVIQLESWSMVWPEMSPLLEAHREEVDPAGAAKAQFLIDVELCSKLNSAGAMPIWAARREGVLVGYCVWNLGPALDTQIFLATQGPWYVRPDCRAGGLGLRLFETSLEALRGMGVQRALPHCWAQGPAAAKLEAYFTSLGATPLEKTFSLWL